MENVFVLISPHTKVEEIERYLADKELSHLEIWSEPSLPPFINPLESIIVLLLSGGTEILVKKIVEKAFSTIYIYTLPINNALSAGAELNGYYHANSGIKIATYEEDTFKLLFNIEKYREQVNSSRLLMFGKPHEWVLTSEYLSPPAPFNTRILPLTIKELQRAYEKVDAKDANQEAEYWYEKKDLAKLPSSEFYNSAVNYLSIKKMLNKYEANMFTLRCKDLQYQGASFCLTMDRFNEEGIVAACEGDLEAAFSLKILRLITGKYCWMTNISHIDFNDNLLYLTHCTVPLDLFNINTTYLFNNAPDYDFMEEFMDIRQPQDITVFRLGKDSRYDILEGSVNSEILGKNSFCRSSMQIQASTSLHTWFDNICGNHQIVVYGKYATQLKHFFKILY
ncbi:MAG: hypothetical protein K9M99_10235 [Candidatus Cloacimonetes bacterium]|nr:hypothetical protein [Candidatus Cloacimonadota bacterium]